MPRLFVYGTLKQGGEAHHLLRDATFVADAVVRGFVVLRDDHGAYPRMRPGEGEVRGEVWEVPDDAMPAIDHWEGPSYRRTAIDLGDGSTAEAYLA